MELGKAALAVQGREQAGQYFATAASSLAASGGNKLAEANLGEMQANLAQAVGDLPGTRRMFLEVIAQRTELLGAENLDTVDARLNYGAMLLDASHADDALAELRPALVLREKLLPAGSPAIAKAVELIGRAELARSDVTAARTSLERALQIRQAALPPTSLEIARSLRWLGEARLAAGDANEAR